MPSVADGALSIWEPPLRRLTLGLTLVVVASAFEALAVATIMPATVAELGGLALFGWTFSAFMLANLVGISWGGSESDRAGTARVFFLGMLLFSAGLAGSGFAPSMAVIVAGRALQGLGAGMLSAAAYASIAQSYPVDIQPRMLATLSSAWVVPGLIGPGIAGLVAEHGSWRWVFLGLVPMPLIAGVLVLPALRRVPIAAKAADGRPRVWLALQLGLGAGAALAGMSAQSHWLMIASLIAGGAIALRALRLLLPPGTLVARAGPPAAIASMALLNFAFFGTEAFVPLMLSGVRQAPMLLSGLTLTAAAISWTTGAWLPVHLAGRVRRRMIILAGLCILGLGIAVSASMLSPSLPAGWAVVSWAVSGFGMGLAFTTTSAAILETAEPGSAGAASASLQLAQVLGAALATGIGGVIVAAPFAGEPPRFGIALVDVVMLVALGLAILAARGTPN
jgi:MFS family permease